ncbi:MAG: ABC transporter permease [Nitrospirota bacterium]
MSLKKHRNILDYTLQSLLRRKFKSMGIIIVFTSMIFMLGSIIFLSYSFKREASLILKGSPELIVQRVIAGRHDLISLRLIKEISEILGVNRVKPRFWGYYYDSAIKANYTILAVDDAVLKDNRLLKGRMPRSHEKNVTAIGKGIANVRFIDLGDKLSLQSADGRWMDFEVIGIFEADSDLLTADLIVMSYIDFKNLVKMPDGMATDLLVSIYNEAETPTIARKIKERFPDTRPLLRDEIIRTYDAVFGWRSGLILIGFIGALTSFIILSWDKAMGLSAEEKKEIGILKAIGWETSDVLEMKFWEGLVISLASFLMGIILAYLHVFFLGASLFAPALKGWSIIYPDFRLAPFINPYQIATLIAITVVPYIASTIIPSWKVSISDPDELMRG